MTDARTEIAEARGRYSKKWDLGGGRYEVLSSPRPLHYFSGSGWVDINPAWAVVRNNRVESAGVGHQVSIDTDAQSFSWVFTGSDGSLAEGVLASVGGVRPEQSALSIPSSPTISGGNAVWSDILPGCDLLAVLSWAGVSWNWVIKDSLATRYIEWDMIEDIAGLVRVDQNVRGRDNLGNQTRIGPHKQRIIEVMTALRSEIDVTTHPGRRAYRLRSGWTGRVQEIDPVTRQRSWSDTETIYPVRVDPTVNEDIASDADDGNEQGTAWIGQLSSALFFAGGRIAAGVRNGGVRFQTLDVPQGATIDSAELSLSISTIAAPFDINVYADDVDDAPAWSDSSRPSQIARTTATASLVAPATGIQVTDVTAIVQEIVNRGGWTNNNDMRFAMFSDAAYPNGYHYVVAVDMSTWGSPDVASLSITYTVGGAAAYPPNSLMLAGAGI